MEWNGLSRRRFLTGTALGGGILFNSGMTATPQPAEASGPFGDTPSAARAAAKRLPNLTPARWIWYPSGRTLANTFVLFRRALELAALPRRAVGWIAAESRYLLEVNGKRIQWGPPPSDPRWAEADPIDLTAALAQGNNSLAATVLYYGHGDGTWPIGKPGFLFFLEIEHADGRKETLVSDAAWQALLCRAWKPGQYKRWYLRALQEEFDARRFPYGWNQPGFVPSADWLPAMPLEGAPNKPALATGYGDYAMDVGTGPADAELRPRSIPLMVESLVQVGKLAETFTIQWRRPAEEYFEFRTPDAYRAVGPAAVRQIEPGAWRVELNGVDGAALTFQWPEQVVGWPYFTIEAPAGTTVEMLPHEAHRIGGPALLNTHFDAWTRFTCREGENRFEPFDFESLRWLQLHIRGVQGAVVVRNVGVRRRVFPWPNKPEFRCSEPAVQRLFDASINTLHNCAQETLVDGMARERQQYSGDGAHQMHAVHLAFGETRLPARFLATFSQGMTKDGYFLDTWPAYDRLARLVQRQLDLTGWGPILDHGVEFNFDCWHHYQYTGDLDAIREPYPRLLRFAEYLRNLRGSDGLLPVENLGIPSVWIDHVAYRQQRHKQCAMNLYTAAAMRHALAPLCRLFGDAHAAESIAQLGKQLEEAAVRRYWDRRRGLFVNNLPWLSEEKSPRTCDRSLATAILFDQCPGGQTDAAMRMLADCPPEMGFSYPCNAGWRLWALAKCGRADAIVRDFRKRWATMDSVRENNTLQEDWVAERDSWHQWSHCAVAPLYVTLHGLLGLRPLTPGFTRAELRPQLADLGDLAVTAHTVRGPMRFTAHGPQGAREVSIEPPAGCATEIVLRREERVDLRAAPGAAPSGHVRYAIPPGKTSLTLRHA